MTRLIATGFLLAHGGVHVAIWLFPRQPNAPFDPAHSWAFGDIRRVAMVLAAIAAVAFVVAGVGYLGAEDWWVAAGTAGAVVSLLLIGLTFTPWWLAAVAINAVLLVIASPQFVDIVR